MTPIFPLGTAYLPRDQVVLRVFEVRYITMMKEVQANNGIFASVLISQGSEVGGGDKRCPYGVEIELNSVTLTDVGFVVQGTATQRIKVVTWLDDDPYPRAEIEYLSDVVLTQQQIHDAASSLSLLAQNVRTVQASIMNLRPIDDEVVLTDPQLVAVASGRWWGTGVTAAEVERAFWTVARQVPCGAMDRYELLQPSSLLERIARLRYTVEHVTEIVAFQQQK